MRLVIEEDYDHLSETAAHILLGEMYQDKRVNLSITAGPSPVGAYRIVTEKMRSDKKAFEQVHFYNFDEIPDSKHEDGITLSSLKEQFFKPAGIQPQNIHSLTMENMSEIEQRILGPEKLDLMLIGLGIDGHFCGNMPFVTEFDKTIYPIAIKKEYPWYREFEKIFSCEDNIPSHMVTMGAALLIKVKKLVLIVNGESKAEALKKMQNDDISNHFPATVLRLHPNLCIIADNEAAKLVCG